MEGSSQQNPRGISSETNAESADLPINHALHTAQIHISHSKTDVQTSPKSPGRNDQPYEGRQLVNNVNKYEAGEQNWDNLNRKDSNGSVSSFDLTESHYRSALQTSNRYDVISGIEITPLIGEESSSSSEFSTTPFAAPVLDNENTSPRGSSDGRVPSLHEIIARDQDSPKTLIQPVLNTDRTLKLKEQARRDQSGASCHSQDSLHTECQQEITLQPSTLTKILQTARKYRAPHPDYREACHTPPPTYQESFSYPPVASRRPLTFPGLKTCGPQKDPVVSIITLSPPLPRVTSLSSSNTRDSVYAWHSLSDDALGRRDQSSQEPYSDHQILALLACIMFWPVGLLAIYYANMANILQSEGIHSKALIYSKRALLLSLVSFLAGTAIYLTFYLKRHIS